MKPEVLFYIIVGIVIFSYVLGRVLEYLNYTRYDQKLPDEVSDVYDQEQYQKSQNYKKVNYRFSIITGTFSVLLILVMFFLEGFAFVDQLVRTITINPVLMAILFIGILLFASDVINTPFSISGCWPGLS